MATALCNHDVSGTADELVTAYGFSGAKAKARDMILAWAVSTGADADHGLLKWERVRATITILQARLM